MQEPVHAEGQMLMKPYTCWQQETESSHRKMGNEIVVRMVEQPRANGLEDQMAKASRLERVKRRTEITATRRSN